MKDSRSAWTLLVMPPFIFLFCFIGTITFFISNNLSEEEVSRKITESISLILLVSQVLMLLMLLRFSKRNGLSLIKQTFISSNIYKDIFIGILVGSLIAISYFKLGLAEFVTYLQVNFGDYVPAGETSTSVGNQAFIFFIANVLFAPFVEEKIYRDIGFKILRKRFSPIFTVLISALLFGILHWLGGFWYILTTSILIGIPFGIIQLKRKTILLVFVAHLTINLIEFGISI